MLKSDASQLKPENRIISKKTAAELTKMLVSVVNEGTGDIAQIPHYEIAGKTGTAQRVSSAGGYSGYIGSFVGFPVNVNRKFVIMAYIDNPTDKGYYGGVTAAPIFKKLTQYILYKKKDFAQFAKYDEKSNTKKLDIVGTKQAQTTKFFAPGYMPDFSGLDKASALAMAEERKIAIEVNGFGVVKRQSIAPGTLIHAGASLRLQFEAPIYAE
jgi:cell division protein FtsI (penicillin-binding protein 3)